MRALTLTQPWASLVVAGAKRIETRSWRTGYRGPLAIHAAKGFPLWAKAKVREPIFEEALRPLPLHRDADALPRGCVIATCELVACVPVEMVDFDPDFHGNDVALAHDPRDPELVIAPPLESYFGDYSEGRFAWLLKDVVVLDDPIPARGALGLWNWSPAHVDLSGRSAVTE